MTTDTLTPQQVQETIQRLESQVGQVIIGQSEVMRAVIICLLARGHVLLEGVPGLGKTLLVRTLAHALDLRYSRIQFTPDLMPTDIIGTNVISEAESGEKTFRFERGPVFANLVLADEVNRATPKTQSALLEAMQEQAVTVGNATYPLPQPFLVLATQNPIEMEGTYPLPEAQLDRFFFKVTIDYPSLEDLDRIVDLTTTGEMPTIHQVADGESLIRMGELAREMPIASHVRLFASRLVKATHPEEESSPQFVKDFVRYGASPRGAQALVLAAKIKALLDGSANVSYDDIRAVAHPALRHRIVLNFEADVEGVSVDRLIDDLLDVVPRE